MLAPLIAATAVVTGIATNLTPARALPAGFSDAQVGTASSPTGISALPDGRALITQKGGALRVLSSAGALLPTPAISLTVCTASEEGLLGADVDGSFGTNGYVYIFYTRPNPTCNTPVNRVSRFTMSANTIDPATELVLLDNMAIVPSAGNHDGGDVHVGNDGYLYVTVGDAGANPRGTSGSAAQDLSLLNGKIVRITTTGGIPADNPWVGDGAAVSCAFSGTTTSTSARCLELYSWGLRNPYRFAFDPNTTDTRFFVNDVGENTWEEVDQGIKGVNYGWRIREGFCVTGSSTNCTTNPLYVDPLTAYNHNIGCSYITAGAFVPNGIWPIEFDGSYLFADGGCGRMWQRTAAGAVNYAGPFANSNLGGIVDMAFVTQGGQAPLYYVNFGGRIGKITYQPSAPTFGTAPDVTVAATGPSGAIVDFVAPTATDFRGAVAVTCLPASGTTFAIGSTSVSCSATNSGGTSTTSFSVRVVEPPVFASQPDDILVGTDDPTGVPVTFPTPAATDALGAVPATCAPVSGAAFAIGVTTVTCSATNVAGTTTTSFTVTAVGRPAIVDTPTNTIVTVAAGVSSAVVTYTPPTASDAAGPVQVSCAPPSGSTFALGVTSVACSASNAAGGSTSGFDVTVLAPPTFATQPSTVTVGATGMAGAIVTFTAPTASDVLGAVAATCAPESGSTFAIGTSTVTCTATNAAGAAQTSFAVVVLDTPVFASAPDDIAVDVAPGETAAVVMYQVPSAADLNGPVDVECWPPSGSSFALGTTTVTCTATNLAGTTATTFEVTVTATPVTTPPTTAPPTTAPPTTAPPTTAPPTTAPPTTAPPTTEPPTGVSPTPIPEFVPLGPVRLADTRTGHQTVDGLFAGAGPLAAGSTMQLTVAGRGGVAADAVAVALNVTALDASGSGFVTVHPCGLARPTASSLNVTAGAVVPNAVIVRLGAAGTVCVYTSVATHIVVDVDGAFPAASDLVADGPARLLDTRPGEPTIDGRATGAGGTGAGAVTALQVTGRAGVPADASAVVVNVTVTEPTAPGYATVYPCGSPPPLASNINYAIGETVANMAITKLGRSGTICILTQSPTHLIVDLSGYLPADSGYTALLPARLMDTRKGEPTVDGQSSELGARPAGSVTVVAVVGRGGVPADAATVVLNVTATAASADGYVTMYPCGVGPPLASNLNLSPGHTVANATIVGVGAAGAVCLFNSQTTDLVVDVNGFLR